jgi:hypothetical protein
VGESNFQFLKRMADKTGYRFWCSGGTLYMVSPLMAIQGAGAGATPVYTSNKNLLVLDTCRNFSYLRGQNLPGSVQTHRAIFGIDAASGKPFSANVPSTSGSRTRTAIKTSYSTQSYTDAQQRVAAWSALSQFWLGATAELYGSTTLYPGKLVKLSGSALMDGAAGLWLVSKVTQHLVCSVTGVPTIDKFISDVVLLRNSASGNGVSLASSKPVKPEFTTMTLNQSGTWIATNQSTVTL